VLNLAAREAVEAIKSSAPASLEGRQQAVEALTACHDSFSRQMVAHARKIHEILMDLAAFLPIWLGNISKRRSMLLHSDNDEPTGPGRGAV
jgi:hypothetical protein